MKDLDESNHRLESLNNGIDDMINGTHQKDFQEMKDQVAQLEERWDQFRRKLSSSIEDNKRAIRRQVEFDQEHQKICAVLQNVLQGTENSSLDQTDVAVNHDRVEVGILSVHILLLLLSSLLLLLLFIINISVDSDVYVRLSRYWKQVQDILRVFKF